MLVLSIDPGGSNIGYTITQDYTVLTWGHIKRQKCKRISKVKEFIGDKIENILSRYNVDRAVIEIHTANVNKQRADEKEIIEYIESVNIPITFCHANDYIDFLQLHGYDKKVSSLFAERQREVFKRFKVKTNSRHNIDCLLMAIYYIEKIKDLSVETGG